MWVTSVLGFAGVTQTSHLVRIVKDEVTALPCGPGQIVVRNGTLAIVRSHANNERWVVVDVLNPELPALTALASNVKFTDALSLAERAVAIRRDSVQLWDFVVARQASYLARKKTSDARFCNDNPAVVALSSPGLRPVALYDRRAQTTTKKFKLADEYDYWGAPRVLYFEDNLVFVSSTDLNSILVCFDARTGEELSNFTTVASNSLICKTDDPNIVFMYKRNNRSMRGWFLNLRTGSRNASPF